MKGLAVDGMELKSGGMLLSEVSAVFKIVTANMRGNDMEDDIDMRIIRENRGNGHPHRRRKACVDAKGDVNRSAGALGVLCWCEFVRYSHSNDSVAVASFRPSVPRVPRARGDHD